MIASILAITLSATAAMPQGSPSQVYRCTGPHGETVFSGLPCQERGDLRPERGSADGSGSENRWGDHCADSAQGLSDRVAATFDSGKVNDLGALFLWRGYGTRAAYRHLNELQTMLKKPLAGLTLVPSQANTWLDNGSTVPGMPESLQVEVAVPGMGDTNQIWRFPVVESDACFWLEYAPMQETSFP